MRYVATGICDYRLGMIEYRGRSLAKNARFSGTRKLVGISSKKIIEISKWDFDNFFALKIYEYAKPSRVFQIHGVLVPNYLFEKFSSYIHPVVNDLKYLRFLYYKTDDITKEIQVDGNRIEKVFYLDLRDNGVKVKLFKEE